MTDTDMNLGFFLRSLGKAWASLLIFTLVGLAAGAAAAYIIPPEWEVTALIEGSRMAGGRLLSTANSANEDAVILLKRLRSAETMGAVLQKAGYPVDRRHLKRLLADTSFTVVGNGVELRVSADSRDKAQELANDFLLEIQRQESQAKEPELEALRDFLIFSEKQREQLLKALLHTSTSKRAAGDPSPDELMLADRISQEDAVIEELRKNLPSPQTASSRFIIPISGLPWPIFPDPVLFAVLGALAGFAAGLVKVFSKLSPPDGSP